MRSYIDRIEKRCEVNIQSEIIHKDKRTANGSVQKHPHVKACTIVFITEIAKLERVLYTSQSVRKYQKSVFIQK